MESTEKNQDSSVRTNGKQVATLRKNRGLTQKQLAKIAGYSERLIRKAESDGSLSLSTVRDLAAALSRNGTTIEPADLVCSPESLTREFLAALTQYEADMAAYVEHFVDPQFVLVCAGDPEQIPFAGYWQGIAGLDRWARAFFATPMRSWPDSSPPAFLSDGNRVIVWREEPAPNGDPTTRPLWCTQRFEFCGRKLVRVENLFDTASMAEELASSKPVLA